MTNTHHTVLYTSVTNNLECRVLEHHSGKGGAFTSKYKAVKLVYFACGDNIDTALLREKQIQNGMIYLKSFSPNLKQSQSQSWRLPQSASLRSQ